LPDVVPVDHSLLFAVGARPPHVGFMRARCLNLSRDLRGITTLRFRTLNEITSPNHLVPVPHAADLDALNLMLMTACRADEARILDGRSETVGAAMAIECGHLLSCAPEGVDLAEVVFPLVDKQGCVTVKTNLYSVPAAAGSRVEARIHPLHVEIWRAGHRIARHERCHGRRQHVLDLEHYLDPTFPLSRLWWHETGGIPRECGTPVDLWC